MKLLTCIAFHFKAERLHYLRQTLAAQASLAGEVHVCITTNTSDPAELNQIAAAAPPATDRFRAELVIFDKLPNPWLLTWAHKPVMHRHFADPTYTHFMYIEDDIEVTRQNIHYWLQGREILKPHGFYPSFLRTEWNEALGAWVSTDVCQTAPLTRTPRLNLFHYAFLNFQQPYQGMFLYDRELMEEHIASPSFDVNQYGKLDTVHLTHWGGGTAENANFGLTFMNVPQGFISRNLVGYFTKYKMLDPGAFVHHLPNNYADNPNSPNGKIPLSALVGD